MNRKTLNLYLLVAFLLSGCITLELGPEPIEIRLIHVSLETPVGLAPTALSLASSPTPLPTETPLPTITQTASPTPSPEPTALPPTEVLTEFFARISLTANCRLGPGVTFPVLTYVNAGEQVLVTARLANNSWFLAQKTDRQDSCWLSASVLNLGQYSLASLPVLTSQPTPAPLVAFFTSTPTRGGGGGGSNPPPAATNPPQPTSTDAPYPAPTQSPPNPTTPPYP